MAWKDYFWPGTDVLRNKLGIHDADVLDQVEHQLAQSRQLQIQRGQARMPNTFDAAHIGALHHWLFQDVYTWAGQYRTVELAKWSRFAEVGQIDTCVNTAAAIIADVPWAAVDDDTFCERAAAVYGWINFAHPYREGNGRAARLFLSAVARLGQRSLNFGAIRRDTFIQRAAFSCPDQDQSEPDHQWMVPVFHQIAAPVDDLAISTDVWSHQRPDSHYDLGR